MSKQVTFGLSTEHLVQSNLPTATGKRFLAHPDALHALGAMLDEARSNGVDFVIISGFRSYADQKRLWEAKVKGERPILDENEQPITDFNDEAERYWAIARWSAVPGLSRHHWGSDFDIFDATAIQNGWHPQLVRHEFDDGPCVALDNWLKENAKHFGFYLPYDTDNDSGVGREPWHISHAPTARQMQAQLSPSTLIDTWAEHPFLGHRWASQNVKKLIPWFLGGSK